MVLAAVVSRLARTKRVRQPAYATPTSAPPQVQPRRAAGVIIHRATAATPDRKLAICHPVKSAALMAAPPVENSSAAPANCKRARVFGIMREGKQRTVRRSGGDGGHIASSAHRA